MARELARSAGYDPDQIVTDVDPERDFDYLSIGVAPVDIRKLKPIFMKFINEAQVKIMEAEAAQEGPIVALAPA